MSMRVGKAIMNAVGDDCEIAVEMSLKSVDIGMTDECLVWTDGDVLSDDMIDQEAIAKFCPQVKELRGVNVIYYEEFAAVVMDACVLIGFSPSKESQAVTVHHFKNIDTSDLLDIHVGFHA